MSQGRTTVRPAVLTEDAVCLPPAAEIQLWQQPGSIRCMHLSSLLRITGELMEKRIPLIFLRWQQKDGEPMLKHMDLGDQSPVEVREAQSVNGPLAILNEYYDVYVTQPDDAKWRLDNMHEVYLKDMNSKYVYPNVFMSIEDTNKISQYDTDIKKYAEQKKADWILNGGIEKEWDSYLEKMEQYGLSDYLAIKQKYFDQYQESLMENQGDTK